MAVTETLSNQALVDEALSMGHELTGIDKHLVRIGLDIENIRFYPPLRKYDHDMVDVDIDSIYNAANAGSERAQWILGAVGLVDIQLLGDGAGDDLLDQAEIESYATEPLMPKATVEPTDTLDLLDNALAAIEVAIAVAKLSQQPSIDEALEL